MVEINLAIGLLSIWFLTFITLSIALFIRIARQFKNENLDKATFWMLIIIFLYGMLPFVLNDYVL